MNFLLINQFFWPDSAATSQLLTDVANRLSEDGHKVTVICGKTGYAAANEGGQSEVEVHRVGGKQFAHGTLSRIASYASFYIGAAWQALIMPKVDAVLTLTTPPLLSVLGNLVKALRGSAHLIWEMDMYPDVAVDLAYFRRRGVLDQFVGWIADASRDRSDRIVALGECMRERLIKRGVPPTKITVVHNWADSKEIQVSPKTTRQDKFVLLYSGNLGLAHDVGTIAGAMLELRSDLRFTFVFTGSGSRRKELAEFAKRENLESLELLPYVQRSNLGQQLAEGDVGLVTQIDSCCGSVVPSKVYGLMAAGRPILFIGPKTATPARIIEDFACGWHVGCGDTEDLSRLLRHLADHPEEINLAGANAREALVNHFDRRHGTLAMEAALLSISRRPSPADLVSKKSTTGSKATSGAQG